jgi:hypothetical protein
VRILPFGNTLQIPQSLGMDDLNTQGGFWMQTKALGFRNFEVAPLASLSVPRSPPEMRSFCDSKIDPKVGPFPK